MDKKTINPPETLVDAIRYFSDPDKCLAFMVELRWPDGVTCPTCGSQAVSFISTRRVWTCREQHERRQFSAKVGTVFEDSPIALDKWFSAMWLIASAKNGISSYEVSRALAVTQKTAWFMLHRIRLAMQRGSFEKMSGEVEVDETFIGGKARFMHKAKRAAKITGTGGKDKSAVMGLLERHGPQGHSRVKLKHVPNVRRKTLAPEVRQHVEPGANVYTDALKSYAGLSDAFTHQVIGHAESYVEGQVHTNGMENFWSLLKRMVKGTYVSVEPFHLFRYLDEEAYRFNTRKVKDGVRFADTLRGIVGKRLTYAALTGKDMLLPAMT
jgi:transposase-like protein